jgi:hypothetical protein
VGVPSSIRQRRQEAFLEWPTAATARRITFLLFNSLSIPVRKLDWRLSLSSTVFDSALFRDMFDTAEMRAVFSDKTVAGRYINRGGAGRSKL